MASPVEHFLLQACEWGDLALATQLLNDHVHEVAAVGSTA
jgi:hypothetical protein